MEKAGTAARAESRRLRLLGVGGVGALGGGVLDELSRRTGMSQQELLAQLSAVLPQLINNLTPKGRMPTLADFEEK